MPLEGEGEAQAGRGNLCRFTARVGSIGKRTDYDVLGKMLLDCRGTCCPNQPTRNARPVPTRNGR